MCKDTITINHRHPKLFMMAAAHIMLSAATGNHMFVQTIGNLHLLNTLYLQQGSSTRLTFNHAVFG